MRNISFDNPWLLLVAIPLLLLIVIPFVIAIRKENKSKSAAVSLVLHLLIVVLLVLAAAGTMATTVITETHVYVVADVSYSAHENLDKIDGYIADLQNKLPENSKVGIICFGKDYTELTPMGGEILSVKEAKVDDSATHISLALNYVSTLFRDDVIKRVVLITDGKEANEEATAEFIRAVENLHSRNVYIDAVYLDDNLPDGATEVQVSGVDFTASTYQRHESTANVLLQSGFDGQATISLYRDGGKVADSAVTLTKGYNIVNFDLNTATPGTFDYEVKVTADGDQSPYNNAYRFTQTVSGQLKVLLISSIPEDLSKAQALYGDKAIITPFINNPNVPYTIEDICTYDEIILSSVDIRTLRNYSAFVYAVDIAVSQFGKSLVSMGDLVLQNKGEEDEVLTKLSDMLPVKFGNSDQDAKLYGIVLDTSRSMQNLSKLSIAKSAAIQLLNLLSDDDYVTVIAFSGDVSVVQSPTKAVNRDEIARMIMDVEPSQGTYIGLALEQAYQLMALLPYEQRQVMLISDGMSYSLEPNNAVEVAKKLRESDIYTSVLNTVSTQGEPNMKAIAAAGGGYFYNVVDEGELDELMFSKIADDLTESVIEGEAPVNVAIKTDAVMEGITNLPPLMGFVYAREKASATTVLTTDYQKTDEVTIHPPVYAYWSYGNGRVSSFTGTMTGKWMSAWESTEGVRFLSNLLETNVPKERIDYPFTLNVTFDGTYSQVEIIPVTLNPYAQTTVKLWMPGAEEPITEILTFDSTRYFYDFATPDLGKYIIEILYEYDDKAFSATSIYNISYSPEYDRFVIFDAASLHECIRNRGTVTEGEVPLIENNKDEIATYVVSFAVPLFIAAVALFVVDVFIRKIKWKDIRSLFGKKA
ncbi:MAG: VWA domain-containing protein [Ruminococcaceae bacterium]|nr:VWA domain-containing protein [Oscillospiraceae bacterium]